MKIKSNKGFVGVDAVIAIVAVVVFSGLIISLMYNNFLENVKIKREALASIYLTEIFENIAIADYKDIEITAEDTDNSNLQLIPSELQGQNFTVELLVQENDEAEEDITKKIIATISYELNDKTYEHTMERIKIKE